MFKKILESKLLRVVVSAILIYFAFRKVDIVDLGSELTLVPLWFVVVMMGYFVVAMFIGGIRWSVLVLENPSWKDYWNFTKANYLGAFYSLFFPSMVAGDMLKWISLLSKYKDLSKTRLASSVLIDRVIGLSGFLLVGWVSMVAGKILNYEFPSYLLWFFSLLAFGIIVFYFVVFTIDLDALLGKLTQKFRIISKLLEIVSLLRNENKKRILKCFLISLLAEPVWIIPLWFYSLIFGVGISLVQIFIFVPVVHLILVLPISIAGFGARENMFLFFFSKLGFADEKVLLMSTFSGIMSVLIALMGGLLMFLK